MYNCAYNNLHYSFMSWYTVVLKCDKITYDVFFPDNLENHLITNSS